MKKLIISIISFASAAIAFAQDSAPKTPTHPHVSLDSKMDHSLNDISSASAFLPILAIGLIVILITQVTRYLLENKLKNKIIDRRISEQIAASLLEKSVTDKKDDSIKWSFLLLGLSGGLTVAYYTKPLDIHSLAIIAFSMGISFLLYYFFLKNSKK